MVGNENAVAEFPEYVSNGEVWSAYAARWSMDDPEGPSITDSSPNRNHGQKTEVTSSPIGVLGASQNFPEGRTDGIKIPASPDFNLGSSFTASMWMKFEGRASRTGRIAMISSTIDYLVPRENGIRKLVLRL